MKIEITMNGAECTDVTISESYLRKANMYLLTWCLTN